MCGSRFSRLAISVGGRCDAIAATDERVETGQGAETDSGYCTIHRSTLTVQFADTDSGLKLLR